MKFWIVTYLDKRTSEEVKIKLASDPACDKSRIKKDLKSVYPEMSRITLRKGKKPASWVLFQQFS